MSILAFLWRFAFWRYLMILLVRFAPRAVSGWVFYHSGAGHALELLFREWKDWPNVIATRSELRRLESKYRKGLVSSAYADSGD